MDTVLLTSAADSSRSSSAADSSRSSSSMMSSCRQTRIWLEEVLKTRLNEDIHISDFLADGELLFEVSKLVWNMLLEKCFELRHLKAYQRLLCSRKSSGRYMPYSNVDSFLKEKAFSRKRSFRNKLKKRGFNRDRHAQSLGEVLA